MWKTTADPDPLARSSTTPLRHWLERAQESKKQLALTSAETLIAAARQFGFAAVSLDGVGNRRGAAVVQQRPAQPQSPQRRRPDLVGLGGALPDAVAGADVVQQQIGEQRDRACDRTAGWRCAPVVSAGTWQAAQPIAAKTRSPSRVTARRSWLAWRPAPAIA